MPYEYNFKQNTYNHEGIGGLQTSKFLAEIKMQELVHQIIDIQRSWGKDKAMGHAIIYAALTLLTYLGTKDGSLTIGISGCLTVIDLILQQLKLKEMERFNKYFNDHYKAVLDANRRLEKIREHDQQVLNSSILEQNKK